MKYVISDIHGEYDRYAAMLEKIGFSDEDELYVIGDILDRGKKPVEILRDMAGRSNVYPIVGNHEIMAMDCLKKLLVEITEENAESHLDKKDMDMLLQWQLNGGNSTMKGFKNLSAEERRDLLDYLSDFSVYEIVETAGKTFILVHGGLGKGEVKELDEYSIIDLAFARHDYDRRYFTDESVYIITGHTTTLMINGKAEIYKNSNNICIDCGSSFPGGRLACMCLDTMEEFYV